MSSPTRPPTRLLTLDDAATMAELVRDNREFMQPWEPVRPEEYFTTEGQRAVIATLLGEHARGTALPHVIVSLEGQVVGRVTLTCIVRGPFLSATLGYWVAQDHNGRGLATAATADMVRRAFDDLGLHRVEAGALVHNHASRRVLERNGFELFGTAPRFLRIDGRWQDHVLYQRLNEDAQPLDAVTG